MKYIISNLPDSIIVDDEISLRAKTIEHYKEFIEVASQSRDFLFRWLPWANEIPNEGSEDHYRDSPTLKQGDVEANWDILFQTNMCGAIGIMNRGVSQENNIEIGYWLAEPYTGKGIVTRCVHKLVDVVFEQTNAPLIEIGCDENNHTSANVAIRCGFTEKDPVVRPESIEHADVARVFQLQRSEWKLHE